VVGEKATEIFWYSYEVRSILTVGEEVRIFFSVDRKEVSFVVYGY
jgi:hypothetical protein